MKSIGLKILLSTLLLSGSAHATVSMAFGFGTLTTSESVAIPSGTLWAIITQNSEGNLPGGLQFDSALSVNTDRQAILTDFAGATIAPKELIGGGVVVATGSSVSDPLGDIDSFRQIDYADFAGLGLNEGDQFGVYWFPGYSTESNVLPVDSVFEIGGFHQTQASTASGGNAGMQMPPDPSNVTIAYYDDGEDPAITSNLFQAVAVPEPSTLLLVSAGVILALRRRR